MFLKFSSIIGFFSFCLKKLISFKLLIHKLIIDWISFLEAFLTFLDFLKRFDLEFTRNTIKKAILTEYPLKDTSEQVLQTLEQVIEGV